MNKNNEINEWENDESIQKLVNKFSASNYPAYWKENITAENGKKYLVLLAEEGTDYYKKYFQPMLTKIPKAQPTED